MGRIPVPLRGHLFYSWAVAVNDTTAKVRLLEKLTILKPSSAYHLNKNVSQI